VPANWKADAAEQQRIAGSVSGGEDRQGGPALLCTEFSVPQERRIFMTTRLAVLFLVTGLGLLTVACGSGEQSDQGTPPAVPEGQASADGKQQGAVDHSAMDHAAMGHGDHQMTPEQMVELREKIPLYAVFTDDQIMENMSRMPPDWWEVLSPPEVDGKVGVLGLGHGYTQGGNEQFKD
jgi:hypothetical protein